MTIREVFVKMGFIVDQSSAKKADNAVDKLKGGMKGVSTGASAAIKSVGGLVTKMAALAGVAALPATALKKGFDRISSIDNAKAKIEGLGYQGKQLNSILESARESVDGTAFGMDEAATTAANLTAAGIEDATQLQKIMNTVADAAAIGGTDMQSMGDIFADVAAGGKLTGDAMTRLAERGIPVWKLMQKATGESMETLRTNVSKGVYSLDDLSKALGGIEGAAKTMGDKTLSASLKNLGSDLGKVGAAFLGLDGFETGGIFGQLKDTIPKVRTFVKSLIPTAQKLGEVVGKFTGGGLKKLTDFMSYMSRAKSVGDIFSRISGSVTRFSRALANLDTKKVEQGISNMAKSLLDKLQLKPFLNKLKGELPVIGKNLLKGAGNLLTIGKDMVIQLLDGIKNNGPKLIEGAGGMLTNVVDGLVAKLPDLVQGGADIVLHLVQAIVANLPALILAGGRLVIHLVIGIVKALPQVLLTLFNLITSIKETIYNAFPEILEAGFTLLTEFASGLIKAIPDVLTGLGNLFMQMFQYFNGLPAKAQQWGVDMINGFITGIKEMASGVWDSVTELAAGISENLHFSKPDKGPLRNYERWMPDMMKGLGKGIDDNRSMFLGKVASVAADMSVLLNAGRASGATAGSFNNSRNVTQNVSISNSYSGGTLETQKNVAKAMHKSATDSTTYMARALAYAR